MAPMSVPAAPVAWMARAMFFMLSRARSRSPVFSTIFSTAAVSWLGSIRMSSALAVSKMLFLSFWTSSSEILAWMPNRVNRVWRSATVLTVP